MKTKKHVKTIYITETDMERLDRLLSAAGHSPNIKNLRGELDRATVVRSEDIPPDVVTMNSRVSFRELDAGQESEITLVYPSDADVNRQRISILAPVGAALLGLSVGDEIKWPLPSGKTRTYKIISVLFQPEAAGQYDL
jgi:regulator of nucleoside diphosphate kinase